MTSLPKAHSASNLGCPLVRTVLGAANSRILPLLIWRLLPRALPGRLLRNEPLRWDSMICRPGPQHASRLAGWGSGFISSIY